MFYVYVLYSLSCSRFYVGMTDRPTDRLLEHNAGKTPSTKAYIPWEMVHQEVFSTRIEARTREKYLKTAAGRKWRKQNIRPRGATE